MKSSEFYLFAYKHPKKRKLIYKRIYSAITEDEAIKMAPKELSGGYLLYGLIGKRKENDSIL